MTILSENNNNVGLSSEWLWVSVRPCDRYAEFILEVPMPDPA